MEDAAMKRLTTKRRREMLELFASGQTVFQVAHEFERTIREVEAVIRAALKKGSAR